MATAQRKHKSLEHSMTILTGGYEPVIRKDRYREDLMTALNWYNANREEKEFRAYAEYYIKNSPDLKEYAHAVSKASFLEIKGIGVIGRLIRRDQFIDISDMMNTLNRLEALKVKYPKVTATEKVTTPTAVSTTPNIQDRIAETASKFAAEVDEQIDIFTKQKTNDFSMKSFLVGNAVSGIIAKKIGTKYLRLAKELEEAIAGADTQLKEAYSYLTKPQLRKFAEFIKTIIADCNQQVVSAKTARKPKARKVKPASVIAAKIKPMKEYPELKLVSIEPAKIIGADELWVYIPASRKLTVFRGVDGKPLSVSRTSITNYDVEKSESKTIRKPEQFFRGLSYGKRAMANAWKSIETKPAKARARINDDMILLAAN